MCVRSCVCVYCFRVVLQIRVRFVILSETNDFFRVSGGNVSNSLENTFNNGNRAACKYGHIIICKYSREQVPWMEEQG